jgi:glutamate--cysteine ligase
VHGGSEHAQALAAARAGLQALDTLPSARVLSTMKADFASSYTAFIKAQSAATRTQLLALPWAPEQQAAFERMAAESIDRRRAIEAADTVDFERFRLAYLAPERLLG